MMMQIPNLATSCRTDPSFPPLLDAAVPRRQGTSIMWTLTFAWSCGKDEAAPTDVAFPAPFARDRDDILAAYAGTAPAYSRSTRPNKEGEVALVSRVGAERLDVVKGAALTVRKVTVAASKGHVEVRAVLAVEAPPDLAPEIVRCLDSDLDVAVTVNGELPFGDQGAAGEGGEDEDEAPARPASRRGRPRKGTVTGVEGDLPPEA